MRIRGGFLLFCWRQRESIMHACNGAGVREREGKDGNQHSRSISLSCMPAGSFPSSLYPFTSTHFCYPETWGRIPCLKAHLTPALLRFASSRRVTRGNRVRRMNLMGDHSVKKRKKKGIKRMSRTKRQGQRTEIERRLTKKMLLPTSGTQGQRE